jgi:hypothetical protein
MTETVLQIKGTVRRDGEPVEGAYLTLLRSGELIAERRTGPDGGYEFHTTPGAWSINCRASGSDFAAKDVDAPAGEVALDFDL